MPRHDFLLVAVSAAVIVLSTWPQTQPRQWVQLRDSDGTLKQYSFVEQDPTLAKLRLSLEKWARAGQETRLAVAQWRAELADLYAEKTETAPASSVTSNGKRRIARPVSFRANAKSTDSTAATPSVSVTQTAYDVQVRRDQHRHWLRLGDQARADIAAVTEIRRSRKALEVPPPILFGRVEPGHLPAMAIAVSLGVGSLIAIMFAAWSCLCPTLSLGPGGETAQPEVKERRESSKSELCMVVPSAWIRVRQPLGVLSRWGAMALLALVAVASVVA